MATNRDAFLTNSVGTIKSFAFADLMAHTVLQPYIDANLQFTPNDGYTVSFYLFGAVLGTWLFSMLSDVVRYPLSFSFAFGALIVCNLIEAVFAGLGQAMSPIFVVVLRMIAGASFGAISTLSTMIIFGESKRNRLASLGRLGLYEGLGSITGLVFALFAAKLEYPLLYHFLWLTVAVIIGIFVCTQMPDTRIFPSGWTARLALLGTIDFFGLIASGGSVLMLAYLLSFPDMSHLEYEQDTTLFILLALVSIIFGFKKARKTPYLLIQLDVCRSPSILILFILNALHGAVFFPFLFYAQNILQPLLPESDLLRFHVGCTLLPFLAAYGLATAIEGLQTQHSQHQFRLRAKSVLFFAFWFSTLMLLSSAFSLASWSQFDNFNAWTKATFAFILPSTVFGAASGILHQLLLTSIWVRVNPEDKNVVVRMALSVRFLGGAIAAALVRFFFAMEPERMNTGWTGTFTSFFWFAAAVLAVCWGLNFGVRDTPKTEGAREVDIELDDVQLADAIARGRRGRQLLRELFVPSRN